MKILQATVPGKFQAPFEKSLNFFRATQKKPKNQKYERKHSIKRLTSRASSNLSI